MGLGPRLPDAGIWRGIELRLIQTARLEGLRFIRSMKTRGHAGFEPEIESIRGFANARNRIYIKVTVTAPDGTKWKTSGEPICIENPML